MRPEGASSASWRWKGLLLALLGAALGAAPVGVLSDGAALVVVLAPAWHASRMSLQAALSAAPGEGGAGPAPVRFGRWLVISQLAASLVLLVAAGLFAETLQQLRSVSTGYDAEHVLLAQLNFEGAGLSREQISSLDAELPRRLSALPGVNAASLACPDVLTGTGMNWGIARPGTPVNIARRLGAP